MKKKRKPFQEVDYWQSNTDLMTGIVLVLLLIIVLLLLYLMQIPLGTGDAVGEGGNYNVDREIGDTVGENYHYPEQDRAGNESENKENNSSSGGGGEEEIKEEPEDLYEFPFPSSSGEEWSKAAVYATVVDEETGRAIREQGITFELYEKQHEQDRGALRFLNTYYPVKTEYRNYETTENGVFYLPEKVEKGNYYFKQISELEGYDPADEVHFVVDDIYDWPDPYVVSIKVSPSKNIISVMLEDSETHEPVEDGTFKVTAAENILTADGSIRYQEDELADTVTLDEEGYGESKEVYLGKYMVAQGEVPRYYAGISEIKETEVKKKGISERETLKFFCEKTKINLKLTDELYTNLKLEGAEFILSCEGRPEADQRAVTDKNGEIIFTNLEKNAVYHLKQKSAPEKYRFEKDIKDIFVAEDGRIEGEAQVALDITNYIARVNIDVKDQIFKKPVTNMSLALHSGDGKKILAWTSNGDAKTFENLPGGSYYILANKNKKYEFTIDGKKTLQEISMTVWTTRDTEVLAGGGAVLLAGILALTALLKKKKKSASEEESV